jgi:hypothetical protein
MSETRKRAHGAAGRDGAAISGRSGALALLAAALALAGCGSSTPPPVANVATATAAGSGRTTGGTAAGSTPSRAQLQQGLLRYAACMRSHGVPDFPDPSASGGFDLPRGADPSSPAFRAAQTTCRKLVPGGLGPTPGASTHPSAQWLATMVKAAQCMRRHGVAGFPDPTTTVPSLTGFVGVISDIDGAVFAFPSTLDTQSPQFTRAARACGFPLHNH